MQNMLRIIGRYGQYILNILSVFLLINKNTYLSFYIVGTIINTIINFILKYIFQDPRPDEDIPLFELALHNDKLIDVDRYGMPSDLSQSTGFSCIFIFLVNSNIYVRWIYLIVSLLTMLESYKSKKHTISQIIIGYFVGIIIGAIVYIISNKFIKGKITGKKDDFCFIY